MITHLRSRTERTRQPTGHPPWLHDASSRIFHSEMLWGRPIRRLGLGQSVILRSCQFYSSSQKVTGKGYSRPRTPNQSLPQLLQKAPSTYTLVVIFAKRSRDRHGLLPADSIHLGQSISPRPEKQKSVSFLLSNSIFSVMLERSVCCYEQETEDCRDFNDFFKHFKS